MPAQSAQSAFARQPEHDVLPLFVNRWSPRAFRSDPVPRSVLDSMVEAARWAPSSINVQPWRFYISANQDATRTQWNEAVNGFNRSWSDKAPVLVWVAARTVHGPNPLAPPESLNRHARFDTGAATVQFVLEGERHGVKAHYMGGVDIEKAHALLGLSPEEEILCALALGYPADPAGLPEHYRARERPSPRKPAREIATFR
ncbi:MAG: nitroreductase family protein [Candidatus Thermoplasmatota archaeon]|jgi:nitroreductase